MTAKLSVVAPFAVDFSSSAIIVELATDVVLSTVVVSDAKVDTPSPIVVEPLLILFNQL